MSTRRLAEICEDFALQKVSFLESGNPLHNESRIKMAYIYRVGEGEKMRKLLQIYFRSSKRRFLKLNPGVNGKHE
jgi:hypothetical protein